MVLNTSNGPVEYDWTRPGHVVNTSRVTEEDMQILDEEPEIIAVVPGTGWYALIGGEPVSLVAFVALDDARMYGVVVGNGGRIDLTDDVEKHPAFSGYAQTNNDKENQHG